MKIIINKQEVKWEWRVNLMDFIEVSAKTVSDAITEACQKLMVSSENLEFVVVEEGSSGFLGIGSKPAVIKAKIKDTIEDKTKNFLE